MSKNLLAFDDLLQEQRGYISKYPGNKKAVMVISGGLDSIATAAFLLEEKGMELFPLHIHRGQTNSVAEQKSVNFFTDFFQKKYGSDRFHDPMFISTNIPPKEFKADLLPYTKKAGHPMRDPLIHLLGVEYAVAASQTSKTNIKDVYCAIVPEDYFPHSTLAGLRANTINACINMGDWQWQITSPNIDPHLTNGHFGKKEEIIWAMNHGIPIGRTISCNEASGRTNDLACGTCSSCGRRRAAFQEAGCEDPTEYYA